PQPARSDSILTLLVFLYLLKGHAHGIAKFRLAESTRDTESPKIARYSLIITLRAIHAHSAHRSLRFLCFAHYVVISCFCRQFNAMRPGLSSNKSPFFRPLFHQPRVQLAILAARHNVSAIFEYREFAAAGGLM